MPTEPRKIVIEALARSWASIDGKLDHFINERDGVVRDQDPNYTGHYLGYLADAEELLARVVSKNPEVGWFVRSDHYNSLLAGAMQFVIEVHEDGGRGRVVLRRQVEGDPSNVTALLMLFTGAAYAHDLKNNFESRTTVTVRSLAPNEAMTEVKGDWLRGIG